MTEREYLVGLYAFTSFGPKRLNLLLSFFGNAKEIWNSQKNHLIKLGISEKIASDFDRHKKSFDFEKYFKDLKKLSIKYLTFKDSNYPKNLIGLDDAPIILYVKGKLLDKDEKSIAVVGTRRNTLYGETITRSFTKDLVKSGFTIVSGLARGIDTLAHKTAIEQKGRTIAVLGCGLDQVYPPENTGLSEEIVKNGAVISEYPLGYQIKASNFVSRNRIISGISKATLVIEGAQKSGTLLTASQAALQGKTVFAVPGDIRSFLSDAPHFLIRNGATLATSAKDIVDEVNV
ncbi:DNA-processing protein DprA [Patescibacteria group bacterium]